MIPRNKRNLKSLVTAGALTAVAALVLSACSGAGSSDSEPAETGGDSEEVAEDSAGSGSFADMDDLTLVVQSPYGPNHFMSEMWVDYAEVVEEKSDGKITFDITYSSALSSVAEQEGAVRDGLLDMAWSMPAYNPTALPLNALVTEAAFLTAQSPIISQLQGYGSTQFGQTNEAIQQELEEAGLVSLLTMVGQMPNNPMICTGSPVQSLSDFEGKRIRVPGAGWATEVEALGATAVNLVQAEVYEALERGVIDCAVQSPGNSLQLGMLDVVDYYMIDSQVNFQGWNGTHIVIAKRVWDELPLEAQQLLWDEAGATLMETMVVKGIAAVAEELKVASETLEIVEYSDDVREAFTEQRVETLADIDARATAMLGEGNNLMADYEAIQQEWLDIVQELGYSDEEHPTWLDWGVTYEETPGAYDAFLDAFVEKVMNPNRPS